MTTPLLLPSEPFTSLDQYLLAGGGEGWRTALDAGPDAVLAALKTSGLRGRGGAGFPVGRKWASIRAGRPDVGPRFVVANGAEGEPGTFKDRPLLRRNPYQVIEGLAIAATVIGAAQAFIAVKRTFEPEIEALSRALKEMAEAELLCDAPITLVTGPEEYLFGEEKALLEVVEGKEPLPRLYPPYVQGLYGTASESGWEASPELMGFDPDVPVSNPTLATNVETLANVPVIVSRGAEWFRTLGTEQSPGVVICTVVGDVVHDGFGEVELGTPLREVIERIGGGPRPGREIKAVLSGVANPVLTADQLDTPVSYEGMKEAGTGLGSCGFIVYDETADMVSVARSVSRFLSVESCGQCPPCKLGTMAISERLERIANAEGTEHDVMEIGGWLGRVSDANRCYLGEEEQRVISSLLRAFPEEFAAHLEGAPPAEWVPIPKIVDIVDGRAAYDPKQILKRPDWTYADEEWQYPHGSA